jgi:cell division protein FtsW
MRDGFAVDKWLLLAIAGLLAVGITMVLSTSYLYSQERFADGTYFFRKQLIAAGIGVAALITSALVPSAIYRRLAYAVLGFTFLVLILVLIPGVGVVRGGSGAGGAAGIRFSTERNQTRDGFYLAHSMARKKRFTPSGSACCP